VFVVRVTIQDNAAFKAYLEQNYDELKSAFAENFGIEVKKLSVRKCACVSCIVAG
jgi:hypothetical protein